MSESNKDKPKSTEMQLEEAVRIVNEAIKAKRENLEAMAKSFDESPVELEGTTTTGYSCVMMVDPKEVAQIYLNHDFPVWRILEEDGPTEMWDDMARHFGLGKVDDVDL